MAKPRAETPPASAGEVPEEIPAAQESLPGIDPLADLTARITPDAPVNPAAAVAALGDPNPPPPPQSEKRGRGRPRGSGTPARPTPASSSPPRDRGGKTKAELEAEVQALRARQAEYDARATVINPQDLQTARETIEGIVTVLNIVAENADAKELIYSTTEQRRIGELFGPPAAPWLAKLGAVQPWVAACFGLTMMTWPKWVAFRERKEREARGAKPAGTEGKTEIIVGPEPRVQNPPSAATMSGGVIP